MATDESAIYLARELRELLSKGGFRLTKWLSNSRKVVESISEAERATAVKNLDFDNPIIEEHCSTMESEFGYFQLQHQH